MTGREKAGVLAAVGANAIFGFSVMFSRVALRVTDPVTLLAVRFAAAFLLINLLLPLVRRGRNEPGWLSFDLRHKNVLPLLLFGLLEPVIYFLCENYGVKYTNATVSGMFIALIPVIAMLLGPVTVHERVKPAGLAFAAVSVAGIVLMSAGDAAGGAVTFTGVLCLTGAALSGALANSMSRALSARYSAFERTYVMMGMGCAAFCAAAVIRGSDLSCLRETEFLLPVLYLAVLSSIGAFLLLNCAYTCLPVAKAASFVNLSTVLSLCAGVVFLGEPFGLKSLIACVLTVAGVVGVQRTA